MIGRGGLMWIGVVCCVAPSTAAAQRRDVDDIRAVLRAELRKGSKEADVLEVDSVGVESRFYACLVDAPKRPATCPVGDERRVARIDVLGVKGDSAAGRVALFVPATEPKLYFVTEIWYVVTRSQGRWTAKATRVDHSEEGIDPR